MVGSPVRRGVVLGMRDGIGLSVTWQTDAGNGPPVLVQPVSAHLRACVGAYPRCVSFTVWVVIVTSVADTPSVKIVRLLFFRLLVITQGCQEIQGAHHVCVTRAHVGYPDCPSSGPVSGQRRAREEVGDVRVRSGASASRARTTYHNRIQPIPIPSYLLAIASGNVVYRAFDVPEGKTWTSGVWAEPDLVDAAWYEFNEDAPR